MQTFQQMVRHMRSCVTKGCHKVLAKATKVSHKWNPKTHKSFSPFFSVRSRRLPAGTCLQCSYKQRFASVDGKTSKRTLQTFSSSESAGEWPCHAVVCRTWRFVVNGLHSESFFQTNFIKTRTSCSHIPLGYWASIAVARPCSGL